MEIIRAVSFTTKGIVRTAVFTGIIVDVMRNPAMILPHASRPKGPVSRAPVSLIGMNEPDRGFPKETK